MSLMCKIPNFPGRDKLIGATSRLALKASKNSPTILMGVGIAGFVGTAVLTARATLKLEETLKHHEKKMEQIKEVSENSEYDEYTAEDAKKDRATLTIQTTLKVGKLYAPAILLGLFSAGCVIGGHHILWKRNAAIGAAYAALQESYRSYRERVKKEIGEEREKDVYLGVEKVLEEIEENGEKKMVEKKTINQFGHSQYSRIFDESSRWWKKNAEMNKMFLTAQQAYANDLLRLQGHLFLNEVYDMLGMERTSAGAVVGWVKDSPIGDGYVDFGIFDPRDAEHRAFINGIERNIWLDFNVQGIIYDLI